MKFTTTVKKCLKCEVLLDDSRMDCAGIVFSKWTDGKSNRKITNLSGRHLHDFFLVKCPSCLNTMWFDALEHISSRCSIFEEIDDSIMKSRPFSIPSFSDYYEELQRGAFSREDELSFRHVICWAGNDRRRDMRKIKPMLNEEIENIHILSEMLDISIDRMRLEQAELKRELGLFDEAKVLLSDMFDCHHLEEKRLFILRLVDRHDPRVRAYTYK